MMAQALYRRWRPQTWDAVVGQDHVVQTLRNAVKGDRVAHAYLFAGPRGTGKTTTARLLAKAVNCQAEDLAERPCDQCDHCRAVAQGAFIDLIEIDAASNTSVEDVRDLRDKINFSPNEGRYKVYIIDEVHMLSTAAFNALLKTLEEPPEHAIFVLATTEVHKIPATVLSRCQRHEFRRIPVTVILEYLQRKVEEEEFAVEEQALELIARQATGSLRDAVSLLDQLGSTGETIDLARAQAVLGTANSDAVVGVVQALLERDAGQGLSLLNQAVDGGADPHQLGRQIVDYLRGLLLIRTGNESLVDTLGPEQDVMARQAEAIAPELLLASIEAFHEAALEGRSNWQPQLPIELALVETLQAREESNPSSSEGGGGRGPAPTTGPEPAAQGGQVVAKKAGKEAAPKQASKEPAVEEQSGPKAAEAQATGDSSALEQEEPADDAAAEAEANVPAELSFGAVRQRWDRVLALARSRDPKVQGLLNSSRPLGLDEGVLVLGFASDILCEKMRKDDNIEVVRAALQEALGHELGVRCVLSSQWQRNQEAPEQATPVEDDGMVATALRDLGAEVAEVNSVGGEAADSD